MKIQIFFTLILFLFSLDSCSIGQVEQEENLELALQKYENWRTNQLDTEKYFDTCPPLKEDINYKLTRYSLPRIEDLGNEGDHVIFDTTAIYLNDDPHIDLLFKFVPFDCAQGAGQLSIHPPIYLLALSSPNGYFLNDTITDSRFADFFPEKRN